LLTSDEGNHSIGLNPVVFFRDVPFDDLESLVSFVYGGSVDVPGARLAGFLKLASELGIKGFEKEGGEEVFLIRIIFRFVRIIIKSFKKILMYLE